MGNPESPRNLIQKERIIKKSEKDVDYVREKLNQLGISADNENINALLKLISMGSITDATFKGALDEKNPELITKKIDRYKKWYGIAKTEKMGLTDEEADVAVKFLDGIKKRFRPEAKGEKPRTYIESFKDILRDYNITLTLGDMNSLDNFPIKNLSIENRSEKEIEENKTKLAELKENMEKLVEQGVTSTDSLFEKLSEIYKEDKDKKEDKDRNWIKYLVQKNIRKGEILEEYLKSYVKKPAMFFLKHHTIKRIETRALYRELVAIGLVQKIEKKIETKEKEKEKPAKLSTTEKVFYETIKGLKKKDLGE